MIDYEDELEMIVTLSCKGIVHLYDWDTFKIVKEISLSEWNEVKIILQNYDIVVDKL